MTAEDTAHHNEQAQCLFCKHECLKGKLIKHHDHEKAGRDHVQFTNIL